MAKDNGKPNVFDELNKRFGEGTIAPLGARADMSVAVIPTGSLGLDIALGVGGIPQGRIVEIYGAESSGKTTISLHMIAEAQRMGKVCAFIDVEHALDPVYAEALGVDTDALFVSQPSSGEEALEIVDALAKSGTVGLVVVDSVAALVPRAELDGEMGDSHMGLQARLMSQALRKLTGSVKSNNCTLVFLNQTRMKIGCVAPETTVTYRKRVCEQR